MPVLINKCEMDVKILAQFLYNVPLQMGHVHLAWISYSLVDDVMNDRPWSLLLFKCHHKRRERTRDKIKRL